MWALFFNTAFNSTKITNTKKLAKVFVNELSLPPPLSCFHPHLHNGLHFNKLVLFLPQTCNCYVIGQLKLKHPWRKMFYGYKGTHPPNATPLPPTPSHTIFWRNIGYEPVSQFPCSTFSTQNIPAFNFFHMTA